MHALLGQDHPAAEAALDPDALNPAFTLSPESRRRPSSHYCRSLAGQEGGLPYHFPTLTLEKLDHSALDRKISWFRLR